MDTCISRPQRKSSIRVTAGGVPVNTAELREYLKAYEEDDVLIARLARRATAFCQRWQGRQYLKAQFIDRFDAFPSGCEPIELRWSPGYIAVNENWTIAYTDTNGNAIDLSAGDGDFSYDQYSVRPKVFPNYGEVWPVARCFPNSVSVTYLAGVGTEDLVDDDAKQAIWMLACHWFRNREAVLTGSISKEVEYSLKDLLGPRRIVPVG